MKHPSGGHCWWGWWRVDVEQLADEWWVNRWECVGVVFDDEGKGRESDHLQQQLTQRRMRILRVRERMTGKHQIHLHDLYSRITCDFSMPLPSTTISIDWIIWPSEGSRRGWTIKLNWNHYRAWWLHLSVDEQAVSWSCCPHHHCHYTRSSVDWH